MTRHLTAPTYVHDPETGQAVFYDKGAEVPKVHAALIGPHLWDGDEEPEGAPTKKPAANAKREVWFAYATETLGLDIPPDATKGQIGEAVEAHEAEVAATKEAEQQDPPPAGDPADTGQGGDGGTQPPAAGADGATGDPDGSTA